MEESGQRITAEGIVLDIGPGIRPRIHEETQFRILCEPYAEYVAALRERFSTASDTMILHAAAQDVLPSMPDGSVDTIFLLDVIEHLEKEDGLKLLQDCERVARRQIVIFTPLGFVPQQYEEGDVDAWGFHGGGWQTHRSGWTPEDFDETWDVLACKEYHLTNGKGEVFDPPAGAMWVIKDIQTPKLAAGSLMGGMLRQLAQQAQWRNEHDLLRDQIAALNSEQTHLQQRLDALDTLIFVRLERAARRLWRRIRGR